jgi:hypothetical protein
MRFPSIKDVARQLVGINANVEGECDVRLQVWDDGEWCVRYGNSQFDQDARGYWGSSSVPGVVRGAVKRFRSREVAKDLIDQARESWFQDR